MPKPAKKNPGVHRSLTKNPRVFPGKITGIASGDEGFFVLNSRGEIFRWSYNKIEMIARSEL